jgi:ABC-type ATPase involved in cell division
MKPRAVPHLRRMLGIVFQDFKLLRDRTVEDNLALVTRVVGMPGPEGSLTRQTCHPTSCRAASSNGWRSPGG